MTNEVFYWFFSLKIIRIQKLDGNDCFLHIYFTPFDFEMDLNRNVIIITQEHSDSIAVKG